MASWKPGARVRRLRRAFCILALLLILPSARADVEVVEDEAGIKITTALEAVIRKKSSKGLATHWVTGVAATSFLDKKTGFRDQGFGLDIVDWLMELGSDEGYRDRLDPELVYRFNNAYHGKIAKRSIEGPQLCTRVPMMQPRVVRGKDFVAAITEHRYTTAAPGKKIGSLWQQTLVFPEGKHLPLLRQNNQRQRQRRAFSSARHARPHPSQGRRQL